MSTEASGAFRASAGLPSNWAAISVCGERGDLHVVFKQGKEALLELARPRPAPSSRSVGRKAVHQPGAAALFELVDAAAARAVR